ncbi:MAG TPA: phosphatase PAP2 family protein [Clostridiaceae bacterium]
MSGMLRRIQHGDATLLSLFNNSLNCRVLDILMPALTFLGSVPFAFLFCIITVAIPNSSIREMGIMTSIALIISTLFVRIIKVTVSRIRPFLKVENLNIKLIGIDEYSFPSGHTTGAFSIAVIVSLCFPQLTLLTILLAFLVGLSRMYFGVHYPTDIIIGMCIGTITSFIVYIIF